jgi:hypothetical protein
MLAAVWMFAAILLLATLFLGREGCLRFTIAVICTEVVGVILMQDVSPLLFTPLNEAVNLIIMLLSGLILPPIVALVIYRNIARAGEIFASPSRPIGKLSNVWRPIEHSSSCCSRPISPLIAAPSSCRQRQKSRVLPAVFWIPTS